VTAIFEYIEAFCDPVHQRSGLPQPHRVRKLFCTADRCPVIVGNTLVYFDWGHMTLEYSRALGPVIGALADRALNQG